MSDFDEFHKIMSRYFKARRDELQAESDMLWKITIELLQALDAAYHDGSNIADLKELKDVKATELREYLESKGAR